MAPLGRHCDCRACIGRHHLQGGRHRPVGADPYGVGVDPSTDTIYVVNPGNLTSR